MKQKLGINMLINVINSIVTIIFPLITFPYVTRILGVSNIGQVNFANSVISYFILFAQLGINAYSIREGAKIRDDKKKLNIFVSKMFSLSMLSTTISYIILFFSVSFIGKLYDYRIILLVLSIQIIGSTIGVEWIFTIFEDYLFATVRNIVVKIISCIALFVLIHDNSDTILYAFILSFAVLGNSILNIVFSRKHCVFKFTIDIDYKKHMKSILILFATSLTVSIFVNSDTTILGLICGDYYVGIYSVSTKVYLLIKNVLSAIITVSISRLAYLIGKNSNDEFETTAINVHKTLLTFLLPSIVGIIFLRKEIVYLISGEAYLAATSSLLILAFALLASLESWFWGQCILIPMGKEKVVFISTFVSASVNVLLNIVLIPFFAEKAAAVTTLLSELICFLWAIILGKKFVSKRTDYKFLITVFCGCLSIALIIFLVKIYVVEEFYICIISIILSMIIYGSVEIILKNVVIINIFNGVKQKLKIFR